ncbi:metallophosphoesterase family protein [Paenibacillus agricola]|uniref:Serine/threonine protein phosphatase n=1 Tax=Paenibacillus agricola TaxID=2716264 RepID=A0ABX0JEM4_9BACL|nr:metallophosphoesterase family protein [Paenibacillus agricola]NHN34607.1 serine/threonine protein phosphatase [Paenibacillus agricola]
MKRTLVISDIHGCYEPFNQLLELMKYNRTEDQLIVLGDYVDRGPCSKEVIEQIMRMVREDGVIALRGNHDQRFIHVARSGDPKVTSTFLEYGGKQAVMSYLDLDFWDDTWATETIQQFRRVVVERYQQHLSFMESLPYYYEDKTHIYVHAGLDPSYLDWKSQSPKEFMYIRELFIKNKTVVNKTVVFGHTKTVEIHGSADIWFGGDKIGIDGGCSSGLQLNGLEITDGSTYRTYKVKA